MTGSQAAPGEAPLGLVEDATILCDGGRIVSVGPDGPAARSIDAPKGSLPNGSGLRFGAAGTPEAGWNLQAESVIWQWVDAKTGTRPGAAAEPKVKPPRTPRIGPGLRIPSRGMTERKGMNSGK